MSDPLSTPVFGESLDRNPDELASRLEGGLKPFASAFVDSGKRHGVDPVALAAIAMHETGRGTSNAFLKAQNAMGVSDDHGPISFAGAGGVPASIERMAERIGSNPIYEPARKANNLDALGAIYAPPGAANDPRGLNGDWSAGVRKFYSQLTGQNGPRRALPGDTAASLMAMNGASPDDVAHADGLAKTFGVPFDMALRNKADLAQADEAKKLHDQIHQNDAQGNLKNPLAAHFLKNPVNLGKASDDVLTLQMLEDSIQGRLPARKPAAPETRTGFLQNLMGSERDTRKAAAFGGFLAATLDKPQERIARAMEEMKDGAVTTTPGALSKLGEIVGSAVDPVVAATVGSLATPLAGVAAGGADMVTSGAGSAYMRVYRQEMQKDPKNPEAADDAAMKAAGFGAFVNALLAASLPGTGKLAGAAAGLKEGVAPTLAQAGKFIGADAAGEAFLGGASSVATNEYEGRPATEGLGEAMGSQALFAAMHLPMLIRAARSGMKPAGTTPAMEKAAQEHAADIQKSEKRIEEIKGEVDHLDELKKIVAASPFAERDPEGMAQYIRGVQDAKGMPTESRVDAKTLQDVFFQDAKTPQEIDFAQQSMATFAINVGVDPVKIDEAVRLGSDIAIDTSKLVARYHSDPVFEAIKKDIARGADIEKAVIQAKNEAFKAKLKEDETPRQIVQARKAMMTAKEEGGAGMSAEEADANLQGMMKLFQKPAQLRGETMQQLFDRLNLEVRTGEDGQAFIEARRQAEEAPAPQRAPTESEQAFMARLEANARQSMQDELDAHLSEGRYELLDAVKKIGYLRAISTSKAKGEVLTGEAKWLAEHPGAKWLFKKEGVEWDKATLRLPQYGHHFETPAEMLQALADRFRTGKKVYTSGKEDNLRFQSANKSQDTSEEAKRLKEKHSELYGKALERQRLALPVQEHFKSVLDDIAKRIGADTALGQIKSIKSIMEKVLRKDSSSYTVDSLKDHVRGTIILKDWSQVPAAVKELVAAGASRGEAAISDPINKFGYRGIHLGVEFPGGVNGEIQLHTRESWALKKITDKIYRKFRNLTDQDIKGSTPEVRKAYEAGVEESRTLWANLWGTVPEDLKAAASASVTGIESVKTPNLPSKGVQDLESGAQAKGESPLAIGEESSKTPARDKDKSSFFMDKANIPPTKGGAQPETKGDIRFQSAPNAEPFFSKAEVAVQSIPQEKLTAQQVRAALAPEKGVKAEELKWIGLDDFLKGKEKVTKAEVLDFIRQNAVQVKEVVKGGSVKMSPALEGWLASNNVQAPSSPQEWIKVSEEIEKMAQHWQKARVEYQAQRYFEMSEEATRHSESLEPVSGSTHGAPKFSQWQIAGGKNYRELLFTLPRAATSQDQIRALPNGKFIVDGREDLGEFTTRQRAGDSINDLKIGSAFNSSHFSESNILAHVRFNERTDADGKRVLFVEEVQSDWHQKGRKEGYDIPLNGKDGRITRVPGGVPDAPFKKSWHELAMKRMLRWGAENGFDRVAWTTGEQQAARYDLSMHLEKVEYHYGKAHLLAFEKGRAGARDVARIDQVVTPQELPDVIGKEAAEKILSAKPDVDGYATLNNADLKVGGEGMKGFYDKILPDFLNKYGKKWGAKVGETAIVPRDVGDTLGRPGQEHPFSITSYVDGPKEGTYEVRRRGEEEVLFSAKSHEEADAFVSHEMGKAEATKVHSIDITPAMKESVLREGQPLFQGGDIKRAAFEPTPLKTYIHLFKTANRSSFWHEATHLYLHEIRSVMAAGLADEAMMEDYRKLSEWAGVKDGNWSDLTKEARDAAEEKIADAHEAYAMEGKAPAVELVDIFRRFKDWMKQIYGAVAPRGVVLNDEVRGVFDRWYASEAEIKEARNFYGLDSNLIDLMTKDEATRAELRKKRDISHMSQEDLLVEAKMKAWVRANDGRRNLEKQARAEVDAAPVYKVIDAAGKDGISLSALREHFGDKIADELSKKHPGLFPEEETGRETTIETLAADHGYESPEALVFDLRKSPSRDEAIKLAVDEKLKAAEDQIRADVKKDLVTPADSETHTEKSLAYLVAEAQALADKIAAKERGKALAESQRAERVTAKAYRDAARHMQDQATVGDASRYDRFARAERKAAMEMIKALQDGDDVAAFEARKKQMLYHARILESIKDRAEIERIQDRYAPRKLQAALKNVEFGYIAPIRELLSRYGLSDQKNESAYDFAKLLELDDGGGLSAILPDFVTAGKFQGDYRHNLTMAQFRELAGSGGILDALFTFGSTRMKSIQNALLQTVAEYAAASADTMRNLTDRRIYARGSVQMKLQAAKEMLTSSTEQMQFLTDEMDDFALKGGKVGLMRALYQKVLDAGVGESQAKKTISKALEPHLATLRDLSARLTKENGAFFDIPELPKPKELNRVNRGGWSAEEFISLMLNTGNAGNLQAIENGYQWGMQDIKPVVERMLKEEDLKAIQGVWDTINKLYPDLDRTNFSLYNRHIPKVQAQAQDYHFRGPGGNVTVTLDGGYYPLKFDAEINQQAGRFAEDDVVNQQKGIQRSAKPTDGMTKARVGGHALPPLLSLDVLTKHLSDTIHFITHSEVVRDWGRLTSNPEWKDVFTDKFGDTTWKEMRVWLKDQANARPPVPASGVTRAIDKFFDKQRGLATVAAFGLNLKSGILIHHSILNAGYELGWKYLASGIRDLDAKSLAGLSSGKVVQEIAAVSPWFKDHVHSWDRDVRAQTEDLKTGKLGLLDRTLRSASQAVAGREMTLADARQASMFALTAAHQRMSAMFWRGAFNKYMGEFADHTRPQEAIMKDAIAYADATTQDLTPSSLKAELNAVQRDQGFMRFLTAFMSWNFKYGGRMQHEAAALKAGKISTADYISHQIHETLAPALVRTALLGAFSATLPTAVQWVSSPLETLLSWVPILKDISKAVHLNFKKKKIDFDPASSLPMLEGGRRIAKAATSTWGAMESGKPVGEMIWNWARAADYFAGTGLTNPMKDFKKFFDNLEKSE